MSINIRLSAGQFLALMGENEYIRDFSHAAQLHILNVIEEAQDSDVDQVDWTAYFQSANEVDRRSDVPEGQEAVQLPYGGWIWFD